MSDALELIRIIKKAAIEVVNASSPVTIRYGTVISVSPLQIEVEQKLILEQAQLVLSRNVTDYQSEVKVEREMKESMAITIHNSLVVGEKVILLRQQEGQKYIVWDRIGV